MIRFNSQFNIYNNVCYGDKSISHRALILSAISKGVCQIDNLSLCDDVLTTANCLRTLGAKIQIEGKKAVVTPIVTPNDNVVLHCQNSGTTARLLAGVVAGLGITAQFVGDESLTKRPMDRVIEPLRLLGANITTQKGELFTIHSSKLVGKKLIAKVNSAQVKSAVLLAGLFAKGTTQYVEQMPTRRHTETMLSACGVDVTDCSVTMGKPNAFDVTIPNDLSSASYLLALALLTKQKLTLPNVGVSDGRLGFVRVLQNAGVNIYLTNKRLVCGEMVADITVNGGNVKDIVATTRDVCDGIDEVPILCCVAIATKGTHTFCDVGELVHKESNRIQAIVHLATVCGQAATFDGRNLTIVSNGILPQKPHFCSYNDHRIAMCGAVLCLACGGGVVDSFPANVSFPEFLQSVGVQAKRFCVVGGDVSKSMSPKLMMHLASQTDVCCSYDAVSLCNDVSDDQLLDVVGSYDGVNVTIPFKRRVACLSGAKSDSVNTVGKDIMPQSTDGYGVEMALLQNGVDLCSKSIWIVGAGGAAEACVDSLHTKCKIQIVNRTEQNAKRLTEKYNLATDIDNPFGVLSFVPECEFEKILQLPQSCEFVFVSDYNGESGLRNQAQQRGVKVIDGLQMLYHQGAKSFSLWTKTPLQTDYKAFVSYLQNNKLV